MLANAALHAPSGVADDHGARQKVKALHIERETADAFHVRCPRKKYTSPPDHGQKTPS